MSSKAQALLDAEVAKVTEEEVEHPDYTMVSEQAALRAIEAALEPLADPGRVSVAIPEGREGYAEGFAAGCLATRANCEAEGRPTSLDVSGVLEDEAVIKQIAIALAKHDFPDADPDAEGKMPLWFSYHDRATVAFRALAALNSSPYGREGE